MRISGQKEPGGRPKPAGSPRLMESKNANFCHPAAKFVIKRPFETFHSRGGGGCIRSISININLLKIYLDR